MNLLSPGPYLFWSMLNGPLLVDALRISPLHGLAFLLGFYGTFLAMLFLTLVLFDRLGRLDPRITRGALLVTAVIMALFGIPQFLRSNNSIAAGDYRTITKCFIRQVMAIECGAARRGEACLAPTNHHIIGGLNLPEEALNSVLSKPKIATSVTIEAEKPSNYSRFFRND